MKRFQVKDNFSIVTGRHTIKTGGEWLHTNNTQVFRGFFEGRYLFDSVAASCATPRRAAAGGFGPNTVGCSDGIVRHGARRPVPRERRPTGGPLLFYLQSSSPDGIARDAAGASDINNEEFALFVQDKLAGRPRPDARLRPALGRAADAGDGRSDDDRVSRRS